MTYANINGAQIFFETYGIATSDQPPLILIHGAPNTGAKDWGLIAPLLARKRIVVVPDCRGHGRSSNPNSTYRFQEMAEDFAGLIHALDFEQADVVGHSNGGNIVLTLLVEHPEVVRAAVLQAANAYVSPDLIEREPRVLDPNRVEREAPEWMEELIVLHDRYQGEGYWRGLLNWIINETIHAPNFDAETLSQVLRPVMVIQGSDDSVNAPARHAQFIASNIPFAELWIPEKIGHTVHDEIPLVWTQRIEDFFERRGDRFNEAIHRLRVATYADQRETIFELKSRSSVKTVQIAGKVLLEEQRVAALQAVKSVEPGFQTDTSDLQVLLSEKAGWALCNRAVVDLRREANSLAERLNQVLVGEAVRLLDTQGEWHRVQILRDRYIGWMPSAGLHICSQDEVEEYLIESQGMVVAELAPAYLEVPCMNGKEAGKLPFGAHLPVVKDKGEYLQVRLPDETTWWVSSAAILMQEKWPMPDERGITFTLDLIKRFIGTPYLWGGRSPFGYDCSGFSAAFWGFLGVVLPRDADQQFRAGEPVEGEPLPGDLRFFGNLTDEKPDARQQNRIASITHVAISLGEDEIIHANGAASGVSFNSLNPSSERYRRWLHEHYAGTRRYR